MKPAVAFRPEKFSVWTERREYAAKSGKLEKRWDVRVRANGHEWSKRFPSAARASAWAERLDRGYGEGLLFDPVAKEFRPEAPPSFTLVQAVDELLQANPAWAPATAAHNVGYYVQLICHFAPDAERDTVQTLLASRAAGKLGCSPEWDALASSGPQLAEVSPGALQEFFNVWALQGKWPTVTRARAAVGPVFDLAMGRGHLGKNPLEGVKLRKPKAGTEVQPEQVLAPRDVVGLARELGGRWGAFVLLCGLSGLRPGEAAAVRPRDLVLPASGPGWVTVRGTWLKDGRVGPLKGLREGATRRAPVPEAGVGLLREYIAGVERDCRIVPGDQNNFRRREWRPLLERYFSAEQQGLPEEAVEVLHGLTLHDLRHSAATMWLNGGVPLKTAQLWGGWKTLSVMLNTYAGVTGDDEALALERLQTVQLV
jgi:integrase